MRFLFTLTVLALLGTGCTSRPANPSQTLNDQWQSQTPKVEASAWATNDEQTYQPAYTLVASDSVGHTHTVPIDLVTDDPWYPLRAVVGPDKKHVVYLNRENSRYLIKVADLPLGTNQRVVAEQSVTEGIGRFMPESLSWFVDDEIVYREESPACEGDGRPAAMNPTNECNGYIVTNYHVDINSGQKVLIQRWMEIIKPLQP